MLVGSSARDRAAAQLGSAMVRRWPTSASLHTFHSGDVEAVARRVGGRELGHGVDRQRVVGGDQAPVSGSQDELAAGPRRGGGRAMLTVQRLPKPVLCNVTDGLSSTENNVTGLAINSTEPVTEMN